MPKPEERTTRPTGYAPTPTPTPSAPAPVATSVPTMPTPPDQAYVPSSILRSRMPGILTDTDQIRQVYGQGVNIRRFWPLQTS